MDIFLPHSNTNSPNRKNEKLGREQVENDPYILANTAAITSSGQTRQSTAQPRIEIPRTSKPLHAEESGEKEGNSGNTDTGTCSGEPNHAGQNNNGQKSKTGVDPLNGLDAYGAELSKDARVWKVYVDEADRYDNELVDGWSKSLDLILVFAALFSAVSTAFIIESSKKLQPDPAEVSAETLSAISQTLLAIASNAQVNTQAGLTGTDGAPAFVPSRTTVIINTLWYLSLSLSIATSLMAMLAKDWFNEDKRSGQ
ncbi:unnamed protein product [Rhizoctonia solani]|uniref:DUF6535 domain-containing protein n=1 Tax=Rhizoctonia solani TaxID=456999 RepID=A0A8H3C7V1_9AGAM|nr:unnamed protein product [Rhizoctonia solani]